jgi:hypothetical protein
MEFGEGKSATGSKFDANAEVRGGWATSSTVDLMPFEDERWRFDKERVVDVGTAAIEYVASLMLEADALRLDSIMRQKIFLSKTDTCY